MFRKVIFLIISIFQEVSIRQKSIILIFFSFLNFLLIIYNAPYLIREFNQLEYRSNIAALVTLFCGALYLEVDNEGFKAFLFVAILFTNIAFSLIWLLDMISLQIIVHFEKLKKFVPRLLASWMSLSFILEESDELPLAPIRMFYAAKYKFTDLYQKFIVEFQEGKKPVEKNMKKNNFMEAA